MGREIAFHTPTNGGVIRSRAVFGIWATPPRDLCAQMVYLFSDMQSQSFACCIRVTNKFKTAIQNVIRNCFNHNNDATACFEPNAPKMIECCNEKLE
jgi:hypothetical protein